MTRAARQAEGAPCAASLRIPGVRRCTAAVLLACGVWCASGVLLGLAPRAASAAAGDEAGLTTEVGPVKATVRVTPSAPRIGDPLRLELEVVAEPGVELLMPEFGEALDQYAIVDFAPSESLDDGGRTVSRQRYTLQSTRSGPQNIPPLLIEFVDQRPGRPPAPDDADAFELLTERLEFEVATVLASDDAFELSPARGALGPLAGAKGARWPWVLAAIALLAGAGPFAWRAARGTLAARRRKSAYEVARGELDALLYGPRPTGAALDAFYVSLSGIVRRYLEGRFGLHSPEQTTDEFLEQLSISPDLGRSHQDLLQEFLRDADLVKFAHHVPDEGGVRLSIDLAQRFLEETREAAHA